jgi:hypothetical protein
MSRPRYKVKRPRRIAPRLANGDSRISIGHGLPPDIKDAIKMIAHHENQSVSWVLEQIIIEYFGLDKPEYVPVKKEVRDERPARDAVTNKPNKRARVISHAPWSKVSA